MIEFKRWVEDIKNFIEKRVGKFAYVWMESTQSNVFTIGIEFFEGQGFSMSFDLIEFRRNSKKQRRSLAKIRRQDLAKTIEDYAKIVTKVANKLK